MCPKCETHSEMPCSFVSGSFRIGPDGLCEDGVLIKLSPGCLRLLEVLICSRNESIAVEDAASRIGSASSNPRNIINVLVYSLRRSVSTDMPLDISGRKIRWTGPPFTPLTDPATTCSVCAAASIASALSDDGARNSLTIGDAVVTFNEQEHALVTTLASVPGTVVDTPSLAKALGSKSSNHSTIVKTILCNARRAFRKVGIEAPIRTLRGRGLIWESATPLFSEENVADSNDQEAAEEQRPVSTSEAVRCETASAQGRQETDRGKRRTAA